MARASALFFTCYQQKFHLISRKKDVVQSFPAEATHMGRGNLECGVLSMTAHSCPGCAATGTCWEHHICTRPLGEDSKPAAGLTGKLFLGGGRVGASGSFFLDLFCLGGFYSFRSHSFLSYASPLIVQMAFSGVHYSTNAGCRWKDKLSSVWYKALVVVVHWEGEFPWTGIPWFLCKRWLKIPEMSNEIHT